MMNSFLELALLIIAGFIGGFLNTVVSSGSAVTLPILISFGISPNIANATNRIPVFVGFLASTIQFHKQKLIDWKKTITLSIPLVVGTIIGVLFVEDLPGKAVHTIITIALFVSFFLAITKFKKLTIKNKKTRHKNHLCHVSSFFGIGFVGRNNRT